MSLDDNLLTGKMFVEALTNRDSTEPMSKEELLQRFAIIETSLQEHYRAIQLGTEKSRLTPIIVCNGMRGIIVRLMQRETDEDIKTKLQELLDMSFIMVGI